jgi:outer membrane receptor protein involved in Fe transport
MNAWIRKAGLGLAVLALGVTAARRGEAQGTTFSAVQGIVTQAGTTDRAIEGATITVINGSTGQRYSATSRSNGRFNVENVAIGGPYTIEARAIGYQAARRSNVTLTLGQRYDANFTLQQSVVQLQEVVVSGAANPLINANKTGAEQIIGAQAIENLPLLGRNFTDLVRTSPQVVGTSVSGQNNRFNNIQIDGGVNNDLFGLGGTGAPGGQVNASAISLEAVKEFQILIAPFDVRQAGFTGGLVNAVTKSGTNEFHGSIFGYLQSNGLVGKDTAGAEAAAFNTKQYGFTASGPIVRDKVHFFVAADLQKQSTPWAGQQIGSDPTGGADSVGIGITQATAQRVTDYLTGLGYNPGDWRAPTLSTPDNNVFGKLTFHLGTNSSLELSNNYVKASDDKLTRNSTATGNRDGYQLSLSGWSQANKNNTTRAKWAAVFGNGLNNEFLAGYSSIRDIRDLTNRIPLLLIGGDRSSATIAAGGDRFSQGNQLNQDIYEITDNLTFDVGAHRITVGTHNEFFKFFNVFTAGSYGIYSFKNVDSLIGSNPNRYEILFGTPSRPEGAVANFNVKQYGFYAEDAWSPSDRLTLTLGLRADLPKVDNPTTNPGLLDSLGVNTGVSPNGKLWSPRFGFNFDPMGQGKMIFRGGVGVFSGRPPYVWVSNAFVNTGLEQLDLVCSGSQVPAFTLDTAATPRTCKSGSGPSSSASTINYFDKNFKYPQALKIAFGMDRQLPWNVVATFDFLHTRSLNQFFLSDVNLVTGGINNEGRRLYGTVNPTVGSGTGSATAARYSNSYRAVIRHSNQSGDFSTSLTGQLQKRFSNGIEFNIGYTWSRTRDQMSLTSSIASSNLGFAPLAGEMDQRFRRISAFDRPHKVAISGSVNAPFKTRVSLFYTGQSGNPYTYMIVGDANADGITTNDIAYIPRDANDITLSGTPADQATKFATLDAYINDQACLRDNRGKVMERNTCRNPWQSFLDGRIGKVIPTVSGQSLELTLDVFNLLSLVGSDWGTIRSTTGFETANLLQLKGYDAANNRAIYDLTLPQKDRVSTNASRWKMQLGAKYTF